MPDFLEQFVDAMAAAGCAPKHAADVKPDDARHRYALADDTSTKKTGEYQFKIDADFAVGWFRSYREGVTHKWYSRLPRSITPEERAKLKERLEAEKRHKDAETKSRQDAVAEKAKKLWARASKTGESAYAKRKNIVADGVRYLNGLMIVPAYINGSIVTLQFIAADGQKRFLKDGRKEGAYSVIADKADDRSTIIVCEGYATGATIRMATGFPVAIAFDAGNLEPVCKVMRAKYPDARIIVAADNDQWTVKGTIRSKAEFNGVNTSEICGDDERWSVWRAKGYLVNTGVEKAKSAAAKIAAHVVWPDIAENDPDKKTDFNDIYCADLKNGLQIIKDRILSAGSFTAAAADGGGDDFPHEDANAPAEILSPPEWATDFPPLEAYEEETRELVALYAAAEKERGTHWRENLFCKDDGTVHPKSLNNAKLFLENDKVLSNLFCYDEFAHDKIVYRCPPWEKPQAFKPRELCDDDVTFLTVELERRGILQPISIVHKLLAATIKTNSRNPAQEYFNRIQWDGTPRLEKWLAYYCGAEFDDPEYLRQVGVKWMVAAIARVFDSGCKFDHIPIFEGPQNAGKSLMLKELATIHNVAYFDDSIRVSDLGDPKVVPKLQGVLIVEIQEMSGFRRKDVDELKQAITTTHDRIVKKYQNEATKYPRQFVFAGTINPVDGYLHDPTGNRRFWPIRVGNKIDLEALKRDKEQLWAEAVVRYKAGEKLYLEGDVYLKAQEEQRKRAIIHPWMPDIESLVNGKDVVLVTDIWERVGFTDKSRRTEQAQTAISKIMTALGYAQSRRRVAGTKKEYCWVKREKPLQAELDEEVEWEG